MVEQVLLFNERQRRRIASNINSIIERSGYEAKIHYNDGLWYVQGITTDSFLVHLLGMDEETDIEVHLSDPELERMIVELFLQVSFSDFEQEQQSAA